MAHIAVFFVSRDGQTRKISCKIADHLLSAGDEVSIWDLSEGMPPEDDVAKADMVVHLAAIRYGKPLKLSDDFLAEHSKLLSKKPVTLLSVNLTARKPHKRSIETSVYLRKWVARQPFTPVLVEAIAGNLDYPRYSRFDRFMIRLIMTMTKGPTDPQAQIEFTDWDQVKDLADRIAAIAQKL